MKKKIMQGKHIKIVLSAIALLTAFNSAIFCKELVKSSTRNNSIHLADTLPPDTFNKKADSLFQARKRKNFQDSSRLADSLVRSGMKRDYSKDSLKYLHQDSVINSNRKFQQNRNTNSINNDPQYTNSSRDSIRAHREHKIHVNYYAGKQYLLGLHTGINYSRATNGSGNIISKPTTGFLAGLYYQHGLKILGGRTELNYSRQGYNYNDRGTEGQIKNDYISLATLSTLTILHRAQIQLGTQEGFLINSKDTHGGGAGQANTMNAFNRFDFGLAAGIEAYPYNGFLVGLRYNLGLTNLVRRPDNSLASYIPFYQVANSYNIRNGVFQIYIGYQLPLE